MRIAAAIALAAAAFLLSGCLAYDVAATAVDAAGSVAGATVHAAGDAVCTIACSSGDEKK
jgi:hypothetical protein